MRARSNTGRPARSTSATSSKSVGHATLTPDQVSRLASARAIRPSGSNPSRSARSTRLSPMMSAARCPTASASSPDTWTRSPAASVCQTNRSGRRRPPPLAGASGASADGASAGGVAAGSAAPLASRVSEVARKASRPGSGGASALDGSGRPATAGAASVGPGSAAGRRRSACCAGVGRRHRFGMGAAASGAATRRPSSIGAPPSVRACSRTCPPANGRAAGRIAASAIQAGASAARADSVGNAPASRPASALAARIRPSPSATITGAATMAAISRAMLGRGRGAIAPLLQRGDGDEVAERGVRQAAAGGGDRREAHAGQTQPLQAHHPALWQHAAQAIELPAKRRGLRQARPSTCAAGPRAARPPALASASVPSAPQAHAGPCRAINPASLPSLSAAISRSGIDHRSRLVSPRRIWSSAGGSGPAISN